jgi:hypothetical protein
LLILEEYAAQRQMSLQEAVSGKYQIVGANHDPANGSYVILADQSQNVEPGLATRRTWLRLTQSVDVLDT